MTLEEKLERYNELQLQASDIESEMKTLKEEIVNEMYTLNVDSYKTENVEGKLVNKQTFKLLDEVAVINYLKSRRLNNYFQTKVNITAINKELKIKGVLYEELKDYCTETNSIALTVKSVNK